MTRPAPLPFARAPAGACKCDLVAVAGSLRVRVGCKREKRCCRQDTAGDQEEEEEGLDSKHQKTRGGSESESRDGGSAQAVEKGEAKGRTMEGSRWADVEAG